MTDNAVSSSPVQARPWAVFLLIALLVPQCIRLWTTFPYLAFAKAEPGLQLLSVMLALLAAATLAGLWLAKPWGAWAALVLLSFVAMLDLLAWTESPGSRLVLSSALLVIAAAATLFYIGAPAEASVSRYQRVLFGFVFCFAGWVAIWGLLLPLRIADALPIKAPPLHARFLGSMYLSGAVFMLLGLLARTWAEVRVVTIILAVWTGMLGVVSALNLPLFDWTRRPTWFWMIAYVAFPLIAAWIAWNHRGADEHPPGRAMSTALRGYLNAQGVVAVMLGLALLFRPQLMALIWPWPIPVKLAQIYGSPFLAYGIGSLYAARQHAWAEARIAVYGSLAFALAVLISSSLHSNLFNFARPSAWIWFGGIGGAGVAMLAFSALPRLREEP